MLDQKNKNDHNSKYYKVFFQEFFVTLNEFQNEFSDIVDANNKQEIPLPAFQVQYK